MHNKIAPLPTQLSQVELAAAIAANTHNLVQNSPLTGSNSIGGKKRVQCTVCFKTFCDKVSFGSIFQN